MIFSRGHDSGDCFPRADRPKKCNVICAGYCTLYYNTMSSLADSLCCNYLLVDFSVFSTIISIFCYFLVVTVAVLLLVFPSFRTRVVSRVDLVCSYRMVLAVRGRHGWRAVGRVFQGCCSRWDDVRSYAAGHPGITLLALLALVVPTSLAWFFSGKVMFDFSEQRMGAGRQIALLLDGEHLIPPLPLPPEAFMTREVEMIRPDAVSASRDWQLMDAEFVQRLLLVFKLMKERHGYEMVLLEGYRTPERQNQLLAKGWHVTQAAANMSYHQYGLAADAAFMRDGRIVISERDSWVMRGYELYGEIAEQVGLTWGGRWKMQDYGHVELRRSGVLQRQ